MTSRFLLLTGLCLLLASCAGDDYSQAPKTVLTVTPQSSVPQGEKHFSGSVKESAQINVAFKTPGQLRQVCVKEGQHVSAGQLIATLDDSDYLLGLRAAETQYNQFNDEVARLKQLHSANALSGNDYEKALSGLEQLEVNLQVYKNKVKYTRLYSPASGVVEKVNFERSEMVDAGTPVLSLIADGMKEIEVNLPQEVYLQTVGSSLLGATADIAGEKYKLRLLSVVPKADNTQLFRASFVIENPAKSISSGMNADVTLTFAETAKEADATAGNELVIPAHCLFQKDSKQYVWVVEGDSIVRQREVKTGSVGEGGNVVVSSGLTGTEKLVKAGVNRLTDGERVNVADKESKTNVGKLI